MDSIDIYVIVNGHKNSMQVNPRCRLAKFIERTEEAFKRKIDYVRHYSNLTKSDLRILNNQNLYLIEDYNLKNGDYLDVKLGDVIVNTSEPHYLDKIIIVNTFLESIPIRFNDDTKVEHVITSISNYLVTDSIKLYFNNKLLDDKQKLVNYGITNGCVIKAIGNFSY